MLSQRVLFEVNNLEIYQAMLELVFPLILLSTRKVMSFAFSMDSSKWNITSVILCFGSTP